MKALFQQYYQLTVLELEKIGEDAIIAFDASFLLDLYRYSADTAANMFKVLEQLRGQIWLPHQAAYEFHKNRLAVLASLRSRPAELLDILKKEGDKMIQGIKEGCLKHPLLDSEQIVQPIVQAIESAQSHIRELGDKHAKASLSLADDPIWMRVVDIFEGKVGPEYDPAALKKIEDEGKQRFANSIPPGYKDEKKGYPYGDLIIWRQLIDKSNSEKRPAFLVTSDVKRDWWLEQSGRRLGPLPELRKEFLSETEQQFHLYETSNFIEIFAAKNEAAPQKTLDEVRKVRNQRARNSAASESATTLAKYLSLERDLLKHYKQDQNLLEKYLTTESKLLTTYGREQSLFDKYRDAVTASDTLNKQLETSKSDALLKIHQQINDEITKSRSESYLDTLQKLLASKPIKSDDES